MARAMYEYTKTVLEKVSFSAELFSRELQKALVRLLPYELDELTYWLQQFTKEKPDLIPCVKLIEKNKHIIKD
ncbi:MAG: hypothetical protein CR968_02470 [Flavobacteriia bacterium]|nr:MAG: hypothetical protein CR968_02470 [Flavobacteriia bacterium]